MQFEKVNALATAVIAFATILGLFTALYYYLKSLGTQELYIWAGEISSIVLIVTFIIFVERSIEK